MMRKITTTISKGGKILLKEDR
jgi:hypothetical protein